MPKLCRERSINVMPSMFGDVAVDYNKAVGEIGWSSVIRTKVRSSRESDQNVR